jgi:diacylglycerol kinase (ATP)
LSTLQVVGLTGWTHLASVKGGFMRPVPLAQGRHIRIVSKVRLPMQVDGEPLIQAPCVLDVRPLETVKLLIPQPLE